jgi:tetratricopeptide (TPR) repeat protein
MRHASLLLSLVLSLVAASAAFAQSSVSEDLLFAGATPEEIRARLLAHADTIARTDGPEASRALAYRAASFSRAGEADSAVASYQRAFELDHDRRYEIADALMMRMAPGDAERALAVLRPIQPRNPDLPEVSEGTIQGMFAWAHYLGGHADSAARLLAPVETWLSMRAEWRYRMACVAFERQDWPRVMVLLTPLAVASRDFDTDVMGMMKATAEKLNAGRRLEPGLQQEIALRDRLEAELLQDLGARRVGFRGADGFPLGGILLAPRGAARPRAAVVVVASEDTLAAYDSLSVGLRRMGFAVMLLEERGSGRSLTTGCPLPTSWRGREEAMEHACATDVRAAVTALGREARADTSHYLVVGVGPSGPIAVEAATRDKRAGVLLLVTPGPQPVERGRMRARLRAMRRPVYFQTGPEDFTAWGVIDSLYRACDMSASRVADSDRRGTRATLFRHDPKIFERFKLWLADAWPKAPAPRATPPSRRRPG